MMLVKALSVDRQYSHVQSHLYRNLNLCMCRLNDIDLP